MIKSSRARNPPTFLFISTTKFELVINRTAAKEIGPSSFRAAACTGRRGDEIDGALKSPVNRVVLTASRRLPVCPNEQRDQGSNSIPRFRWDAGPLWVVCHERSRSKRRRATVREMKEGPFGFGNQVLILSHCKLLRPKVVVVSVAVKSGQEVQMARSREASASKPSMKCRKRIRRCQNRGDDPSSGISSGDA